MTTQIKRAYDKATKTDGFRVLIDHLWPRGISKVDAKIDYWAEGLAPSTELRKWLHVDRVARDKEFQKKYKAELKAKADYLKDLKRFLAKQKKVTLITAVKAEDFQDSQIVILYNLLK